MLLLPWNRLFCAIGIHLCCGLITAPGIVASEPDRSLSRRFADSDTKAVPDFQKHIVPLLGRLGCNGRACHGSFQGRGDFQLSLFGYDFKADHQALLDEGSGRIDLDDIDESLILAKPTDADQHEGGKRFEKESWQHHVIRRWIETGAKFQRNKAQALERLEVIPDQIQFDAEDQDVNLTVNAYWEDGTSEDVTELCRFHTNNDAIAEVDEYGLVRSQDPGDTHVVVSYDSAVVPIEVIRPYQGEADLTESSSPHRIDQIVQAKLNKLRITPSPTCSDADFIRRVSLDITGVLPSSQKVKNFLADESSDKRSVLIDQLLQSPGYSAWWATRFSDWTGNNAEQLNNALPVRDAASRLWYEWLRTRIESNMPYDEIAEGIVTAGSRQGDEDYLEYCEAMTEACKPGNEERFAARDGLPLFWSRKNFQKPEERAVGFAYTFLGIRIECAQCHKHPFDRWSKDDFQNFARLFSPIRSNANSIAPDAKENRQELIDAITDGEELKGGKLRRSIYAAARQGKVVPFAELLVNTQAIKARARRAAKKKGRKAPMRIPSGKILGELAQVTLDADTRPALMEWLRSPDNPYFANAIVNRVWSNYFGAGIVDPTDDMNLANPPRNAELLEYLAAEFIAHQYDLQWLHRTITTSQTYQRSAETSGSNNTDRTNFSRHVPRRLPAEVVYDATVLATASDRQAKRLRDQLDGMAIANGKARKRNRSDFAMTVFGQSIRESNCDCDRSDSPSLLQSVYLRNDRDIHAWLTARDGWVAQACATIGVAGPTPRSKAKLPNTQAKATAMEKRFLARVQQFKSLPEAKRTKRRPQVKRDYARISEKLRLMGHDLPPLKTLLSGEPIDEANITLASEPDKATNSIDNVVEDAYLRTLSRYPNDDERQVSLAHISESTTQAAGIESLMWALVNTKEFIITH